MTSARGALRARGRQGSQIVSGVAVRRAEKGTHVIPLALAESKHVFAGIVVANTVPGLSQSDCRRAQKRVSPLNTLTGSIAGIVEGLVQPVPRDCL